MEMNDIVAENYEWILSQARRYCHNIMDAEDLAGEVVCKILLCQNYDESRPFRSWCSVILLNTYITLYNHNHLIGFVSVDNVQHASSYYDTYQNVYADEIKRIIELCTKKSCAVDCVRMYSEGYSYEEISAIHSIPVGTVRSRISFARRLLRKELEIR